MIKKALGIVLALLIFLLCPVSVYASKVTNTIADNEQPIDGNGTKQFPYRYLINEESRVVWKHLVAIQDTGNCEVYECRKNNDENGKLLYSYVFDPENLKQSPDGPYYLGLRTYDGKQTETLPEHDSAIYFSLATKRNFPGKVKIKLSMNSKFENGDRLTLMYYGGYDSTVLHGAAPVVMVNEILDVDTPSVTSSNITVEDGDVIFFVRTGGNYVLARNELNFTGLGAGKTRHYDASKTLGTIDGLFTTKEIARAVANAIGCTVTDSVTQGDIDSIKRLYLSGMALTDIKEISRTYFARMESLDLSNNGLTNIDTLSMPALTHLDVSGNTLSSLGFISDLHRLQHLNAACNELVLLPDFDSFPKLITLDLHDNQINNLPSFEGTALRYLDISENQNMEIKADLSNIESVKNEQKKAKMNSQKTLAVGLGIVFIISIVVATKKSQNGEEKYER